MAKVSSEHSAFLGLGMELLMLGIATGIASVGEDVGTIMVAFMVGLLLLWLMYHSKITGAIPAAFTLLQKQGTIQ